jgi:outer membrane receptor protein involved in Fe transport
MTTPVTRTLFLAAIIAIAIPGVALFAQTPAPAPAPTDQPAATKPVDQQATPAPPKVTEEVVVTARKREETIEDVPMSVAAPTESELRDRGAENIQDVAANVAGFTVQNLDA